MRGRILVAWGCLAFLGLLSGPDARSQSADFGASVEVAVSDRSIESNGIVRVSITVTGPEAHSVQLNGSPPDGKNLIVSGTVSQSVQSSSVNGRRFVQLGFSMRYVPSGVGKGQIPSFVLTNGSKTHRTEPIDIVITRAEQPEAGTGPTPSARDNFPVDVVTRLSRRTLYLGEALTVEYVLRTRVSVSNFSPQALPTMPGFLIDDVELNANDTRREVTDKNGETWLEYTLFRRNLTPTRAGDLQIPSVPFILDVDSGRRSSFFSRRTSRIERIAGLRTLEIRALPSEGQPADFSGAVGTFEMTASLSSDEIDVGDAVDLVVDVRGSGPLSTADAPTLDLPGDVQSYEPQERSRGRSRRTWTYPLVPRAPGEIAIDGVSFSYFNTKTEAYERLNAEPLTLRVGGSALSTASVSAPASVEALGSDLHHIQPLSSAGFSALRVTRSSLFWGVAVVPLLALPLLFAASSVFRRYAGSEAGLRAKTARDVRHHLARSSRAVATSAEDAARELLLALHTWSSDVIGEPSQPLGRSKLYERLESRIGAEEATQAVELLDRAEASRYAGQADSSSIQALIDQARQLTRVAS